MHRTCSTCIELLDYNCLYFTGLPHAGESEVWETETRSDLAEDIGEIADVECTMDEIEDLFPQTQKKLQGNVDRIINFSLSSWASRGSIARFSSFTSAFVFFYYVSYHRHFLYICKRNTLLFPPSLHCLHKLLGYQKDEFMKYVVCANAKCSAVYKYDDCVAIAGRHWSSKLCSNLMLTGTILVMTC